MAEAITGRIYRIISESHPEVLPYYGSTIQPLKKRWNGHKTSFNSTCSSQLMEFEDVRMELVEEFVCESITTLHQREQWYIDNHPCCNEKNAYVGMDSKEYNKAYRQNHKEQLKAYDKANSERKNELQRIRRAKLK